MNTIEKLGDEETFRNIVERTITEFEDSEMEAIGEYAFHYCSTLTSISLPSATRIRESAFGNCSALTSVSLPAVTEVGRSAFEKCSALTSISLPAATRIVDYAFRNCSALISVSLPTVKKIESWAFDECSKLTTLYIGTESDTVCTLASTYAFPSNVTNIYVPVELVDAYKTATNWSSFASNIQGYETPVSCQSLTITAEDVPGYKTSTIIHYEAVCTYSIEGMMQPGTKTFKGTAKSDTFDKNPSKESPRQIEISYTFLGQTATTTITQGVAVDRSIEVTTSGIATYGWVTADSTYNVEGYDAYMSDSKGKSSSQAVMKLTCIGYSELTLYIRSNAESYYDYTIASKANVSNYPASSDSADTLSHTKSKQNSGTALSNYTAVNYTELTGNDTIYIVFVKDGSGNDGDDRGFVLIPQE